MIVILNFLGLVGYYRKFLAFFKIVMSLNELTKKGQVFVWIEKM